MEYRPNRDGRISLLSGLVSVSYLGHGMPTWPDSQVPELWKAVLEVWAGRQATLTERDDVTHAYGAQTAS